MLKYKKHYANFLKMFKYINFLSKMQKLALIIYMKRGTQMNKNFIKKIVFVGIVLAAVLYLEYLLNFGSTLLGFFVPLIIGGMLAFVMNVLMSLIENKLLKKIPKANLRRGLAVVLTLLIVLAVLTTLLLLVIPEMQTTFGQVADELPGYIESAKSQLRDAKLFGFSLAQFELSLASILEKTADFISNSSVISLSSTLGFTTSIVSTAFNIILGLVFAIYILFSKETLGRQAKLLLQTFLPEDKYQDVLEVSGLSYKTFRNFVSGQFLEALIIGLLCLAGMLIFSFPYAIAISALVGFTALIPVFGALIGTAVGAFLIVMVSPIKALWFVIFIIVLQQLEGDFIYPRVVGESIGLPSIWVLAAVTIGGSAYGILGMLIGVPISSIIYTLLKRHVHKTLAEKQ